MLVLWQQLPWRCGAADRTQLAVKMSFPFSFPPTPLQVTVLSCGYTSGDVDARLVSIPFFTY